MRHIYVHVPFCSRRCSYCDFKIAVRRRIPRQEYVEAIGRERALREAVDAWDPEPPVTLYLGGGTPSLLGPDDLAGLIRHLGAGGEPREVTLEANPEHVDAETARAWVRAGVTRVSLGVQSFDDRALAWMHRTHDAEGARRAARVLRQAGVRAVSLDLIFGLPLDLGTDFCGTLKAALDLEPEHLSVYGLTVEARTPLARWIAGGSTLPVTDERYAEEFLQTHELLVGAGLEHYEVSNYARPGHRAEHNSAYWSGASYAGLGPAAHSYDGVRAERRWNVDQWADYARRVAAGMDPEGGREVLGPRERRTERLYLALRTAHGLPASEWPAAAAELERSATARGWLRRESARVCLTAPGWLRLDELVAAIDHLGR